MANGHFQPDRESANSITTVEGDIRPDPEGIAPARKVNLITWKDSRNAERSDDTGRLSLPIRFQFR